MKKDSSGYRHSQYSVGLATVHLVWIPKRRKPILEGKIKLRLSEILDSVAHDREWIIKVKEIAPDYVYLLVEHDGDSSIHEVVKAFKGRSSRLIRDEFPELQKLPSLWTRSYFYGTSGNVSMADIKAYINDPHHDRH
jgi:putative transposase